MSDRIYFGQAFKKILKQKGLNQGDISRSTGLERTYINRFANDHIPYPRLYTVARFAKAVGLGLNEFIALALKEKRGK
jgi:transcriptional regulator with XRE-family HTH domain